MKLFVTRHGETDANADGILSGRHNAMLTELGKKQAEDLALKLAKDKDINNITTIYVSSLKRARDTSAFIEKALGIKAIVEPRLQEFSFGDLEAKPWVQEEFLDILMNPFVKLPNGESLAVCASRVYSVIEDVKKRHANQEGNVLFVCHGLVSLLILSYFENLTQADIAEKRIGNCELLEFDL